MIELAGYTDGKGKLFTGKDIQKEVWKWYKFLKQNGYLYEVIKKDYINTMSIEKIKGD